MRLGVFVSLDKDIDEQFKLVSESGFTACQLSTCDDARETDEIAKQVVEASKKYNVEVSAYWKGWDEPRVWNFTEGYTTLGIVPVTYRHLRLNQLKHGSDFAKKIGVENLITHVGFIPENPWSTEYHDVVSAVRTIANYCKQNGQYFLFETGQETPITLLRIIEDVGTGNLGINLDTANLIIYGKGNPVDALEVFGKYVRTLHLKDGIFPWEGYRLGKERKIGEGKVDFEKVFKMLKELNFNGVMSIEREITGDQQMIDIIESKKYFEEILKRI